MISIEKQVITLEQAKRLKELGIEQDSLFYWINCYMGSPIDKWEIVYKDEKAKYRGICESYSAFTIGELYYIMYNDSLFRILVADVELCASGSKSLEKMNRIIKG